MAINDRFMLPKRVRTMEQMADLLATEQAELDQTQRTIAALEKQLTISTSTCLLPRHERLFGLPVNTTESMEVRRARVRAKLNTRGTTTAQGIIGKLNLCTGCWMLIFLRIIAGFAVIVLTKRSMLSASVHWNFTRIS